MAKKKVTVNAVAPGFIRTDMTGDLDEAELKKLVPAGRFGEPEEVADLVASLFRRRFLYYGGGDFNKRWINIPDRKIYE